jgi:DNA primase
LLPEAAAEDFRRYVSGKKTAAGVKEERKGDAAVPIRMNDELLLLIVVALDYISSSKEKLFPQFRVSLEISGFEDPHAKEIYVALEECFRYGEEGMDELLARVSSPELKKIIVERSVTGEFSINAEQFVNDGIKKIKRKGLEQKQEEIIIKLRSIRKNLDGKRSAAGEGSNSEALELEVQELLAEKMQVDEELNQMKQGRSS